MKKKLIKKVCAILPFCCFAMSSNAQPPMYIKNTSSCAIEMSISGHDASGSYPSLMSNVFTIGGGGTTVNFNDVTDLNTTSSPAWLGAPYPGLMGTPPSGWDAAGIRVSGGATPFTIVGNPPAASSASVPGCTGVTAQWVHWTTPIDYYEIAIY